MQPIEKRMELVQSALGQIPFDTLIRNVQVVNVHSGEIIFGAIGIKNGRIATFRAAPNASAGNVIDGGGYYALPGFIDTHVHVDSTLLTPGSLAELIVPHGTTALFADPMEIANAAGIAGVDALFQGKENLPYHVFLEVSSRVPTAPGLETTGGELGLEEVKKLLNWPESVSLGELDPSKVLGLQEEYFAKIQAAHSLGKIANGHAAGLSGVELDAYASAGLADDHECLTYAEAKARIELGMHVLVREGSTERNLEALVKGLVAEQADTNHWMMCTDDKHPNEILGEGHIDFMVNKAIALGLSPIQAIQMATCNAAAHFHIEHEIGSLAPGRWADIILSPQINPIQVAEVFYKGERTAQHGSLCVSVPPLKTPTWLRQTVHLTRGLRPEDYYLRHPGPQVNVHVIEISPDQITNHATHVTLPVSAGHVLSDPTHDLIQLAVVERYGKNGNIGLTFVRGFGFRKGAISSTVSHDHHNLVIAGADEESMVTCARATRDMQGGLVVARGSQVLARLPLPLAGLLSDQSSERVIEALETLNQAARDLGCVLPAPFMSLSFISLPTVPDLGLTDKGLVDVKRHRLIPPFA